MSRILAVARLIVQLLMYSLVAYSYPVDIAKAVLEHGTHRERFGLEFFIDIDIDIDSSILYIVFIDIDMYCILM